jgi:hypothetical protein
MTAQIIPFPHRADPLLSKKQLARHLRCSPRTVERRVADGMPSEWIEGARYFKLRAVLDWEERCRNDAAAS